MRLRHYETLLLFNPDMNESERQEVIEDLTKVIEEQYKGKLVAKDEWGIRELAYPVKKHTRGYYLRLEYAVPADGVAELERKIRINEDIFKFLTVKLSDKFQEA